MSAKELRDFLGYTKKEWAETDRLNKIIAKQETDILDMKQEIARLEHEILQAEVIRSGSVNLLDEIRDKVGRRQREKRDNRIRGIK